MNSNGVLATVPVLKTARNIKSGEQLLVIYNDGVQRPSGEEACCTLETQRIASRHHDAGVRALHVPRAAGLRFCAGMAGGVT